MTEDREDRARYEVLFEHLETRLNAFADQQSAMFDAQCKTNERLGNIEAKVDRLEIKVDVLEKFASDAQRRLSGLEAFATDTQQQLTQLQASGTDTRKRLGRIEAHLQLNGSHPHKTTRATPARRSKKR